MALLRDLWHFDNKKSPRLFYNELTPLNEFYDTTKASPEILKQLQIQELKKMYANKGEAYEQLNKFLRKLLGSTQGTEDDLFAKLVKGINAGLDEFKTSEHKHNKDWNKIQYYNELDNIIAQINEAVNKITEDNGIPAPSLAAIKHAVGYHNYNDFIAAKGQYLEDLGT